MSSPTIRSQMMVRRAALWQFGAILLIVAVAFALAGGQAALGALAGGFSVWLGTFAAAQLSLGGGVAAADAVMLRWVLGTAVRWLLVIGGLVLAIGVAGWPPVWVLSGVLAAVVGHAFGMLISTVRKPA